MRPVRGCSVRAELARGRSTCVAVTGHRASSRAATSYFCGEEELQRAVLCCHSTIPPFPYLTSALALPATQARINRYRLHNRAAYRILEYPDEPASRPCINPTNISRTVSASPGITRNGHILALGLLFGMRVQLWVLTRRAGHNIP